MSLTEYLWQVLIKATDQNKQNLKNHVSALMPDGGTNFRAGFATAVEMLKESRSTGATTTCSSVILSGGQFSSPRAICRLPHRILRLSRKSLKTN